MRRAAWVYAALTAVLCLFHLGVAAGMPWGHLTMGGQWPGVLPPVGRAVAVANAGLLGVLAALILARAGVLALPAPRWAIWGIVGFFGLSVVVHIITPSAAERALWLPVVSVMLVCAVVVARHKTV
jgi:hypothetical protein